jgi:hypothetical protein
MYRQTPPRDKTINRIFWLINDVVLRINISTANLAYAVIHQQSKYASFAKKS